MLNLDTGEWTEVLNESGIFNSNGLFVDWPDLMVRRYAPNDSMYREITAEAPTSGRYSMVLVVGSYTDNNNSNISDVAVNNIKVTGKATLATNNVVERVIKEIRYQNLSDLTAANASQQSDIRIEIGRFDGTPDTLDIGFLVEEVNDNPIAQNPNQLVDVTDTLNWDTPRYSGDFDILDPDANTIMRYYSIDDQGLEIVDSDTGHAKSILGSYGVLEFGGQGAGWTYTLDPFKFNLLHSDMVVNEVFPNLQGTDGDGGIVNLSLMFRLKGAADETNYTLTDTSASSNLSNIDGSAVFASLANLGYTFGIAGDVDVSGDEIRRDLEVGSLFIDRTTGRVRFEVDNNAVDKTVGAKITKSVEINATNSQNQVATHTINITVVPANDQPILTSGVTAKDYFEDQGPEAFDAKLVLSEREGDLTGVEIGVRLDDTTRVTGDRLTLIESPNLKN